MKSIVRFCFLQSVRHNARPQATQIRFLYSTASQEIEQAFDDKALPPILQQRRNFGAGGKCGDVVKHEQHALFQQQMQELQDEREFFFGVDDDSSNADPTSSMRQKRVGATLQSKNELVDALNETGDWKAQREALFEFTEHDRRGWSNSKTHKISSVFMQQVNAARDAHFATNNFEEQQEQQQQIAADRDTNSHPLTHISDDGTSVYMVNVGNKATTDRVAVAESIVLFPSKVWDALTLRSGKEDPKELVGPKGPVLNTAKIAGIMAAKKTSDLIPLCHTLPLNSVNVEIDLDATTQSAVIQCECRVTHKTGVEMEALTGASVAALTLYDMCKAISHDIEIQATRLIYKEGGKGDVDKRYKP